MNIATFNALRSKFVAAYDAVNGAGTAEALPPGTLQAILMALLNALVAGGCIPPIPTPAIIKTAVADAAIEGYLLFVIHREIVGQIGRLAARKVDSMKILAATRTTVEGVDDATLQGVIDSINM